MRPIAALVLPCLLVTACGDGDDTADEPVGSSAPPAATTPPASDPDTTSAGSMVTIPETTPGSGPTDDDLAAALVGRTFLVDAVEGETLVPGSSISMNFDVDRFGASPGCNTLGSTWAIEDGVLVVDELFSTEMACDAPLMAQDDWVATLVAGRPTVTLDGDTLTLTGDAITLVLTDREVADPDRPLEGTTWELESLISADAVSTVPTTVLTTPTLRIVDGRLEVHTGCNTGGADVTVADATMTISPLVTTRMACADPDGQEVEAAVTGVLDGEVTYEIEAGVLTITNGTDGLGYRAVD